MVTLESSLAETEFPTSSFKKQNRYKIQNRTFFASRGLGGGRGWRF